MLEVNEETLNQLRRDVQEMKSQLLELKSHDDKRAAELRGLRETLENITERQIHRT